MVPGLSWPTWQVSGLYGTLTGIETMTEHKAERAPWGDFPAVVRNGDLKDLSKEPEYEAAKHGDHKAMSYKRNEAGRGRIALRDQGAA